MARPDPLPELKGREVDNLPPLSIVRHLEDVMGPVLYVTKPEDGDQLYLHYWCNRGDSAEHWVVTPVTAEQVSAYVERSLTLWNFLYEGKTEVLVQQVDYPYNGSPEKTWLVQLGDLPAYYAPEADALYLPPDDGF